MVTLRRKTTSETAASPQGALTPLATNFDYLSGSFRRAERGRQAVALTTLVGVAAAGSLLFMGIHAKSTASDDLAATQQATTTADQVRAQLDRLDRAGGIPAETLRTHAMSRQSALKEVVSNETDVSAFLLRLAQGAPTGVSISAVKIADPAPPQDSTAAAGSGTATTDPAASTTVPSPADTSAGTASTTGTAPAPTGSGPKILTVSGNANSFADIGTWVRQLQKVRGVTKVTPTWTGGGESLVVTLTADLTADLRTGRAVAASTADEYGLTNTANPTGTGPGASASGQAPRPAPGFGTDRSREDKN